MPYFPLEVIFLAEVEIASTAISSQIDLLERIIIDLKYDKKIQISKLHLVKPRNCKSCKDSSEYSKSNVSYPRYTINIKIIYTEDNLWGDFRSSYSQ